MSFILNFQIFKKRWNHILNMIQKLLWVWLFTVTAMPRLKAISFAMGLNWVGSQKTDTLNLYFAKSVQGPELLKQTSGSVASRELTFEFSELDVKILNQLS